MSLFHESTIATINQRLKLPTVHRNILLKFHLDLSTAEDLHKKKNIQKIKSFTEVERNEFLVELGGLTYLKKTESYINENIIRVRAN